MTPARAVLAAFLQLPVYSGQRTTAQNAAKLVLWSVVEAIEDNGHDHAGYVYVRQEALADRLGYSGRTIRRALQHLADRGVITYDGRRSRKPGAVYLNLDWPSTGQS